MLLAEFADSAINYRVRVWTTDFAADERVRDHVRARVYYAFSRRGIAFPYPVRVNIESKRHLEPTEEHGRASALDGVAVLAALSASQRGQLASMSRLLLYGAGEVIAHEGDPGASMFVLRGGEAAVTVAGADGELARLTQGAVFGEMSLLTGDTRSATVTAVTDCELLEIGVEAFRRVVMSDATSVERVAAAVSARRGGARTPPRGARSCRNGTRNAPDLPRAGEAFPEHLTCTSRRRLASCASCSSVFGAQ